MALKNKIIMFLLFGLFLIKNIFATDDVLKLPELMAKQSNENIRLISEDGKYTYYQKRSGSLLFSKNYNVQEIIKGPIGTQYSLVSTSTRKKILISKNDFFNSVYSLRMKEKIFITNFGDGTTRAVGEGLSPQLHLDDTWLSYYDPTAKTIFFENSNTPSINFSITLNNRLNPYFIPQVVMVDENTIYYTDLGLSGSYGLIYYKRNFNKSEIIYKSSTLQNKIEIISCAQHIILGLFGIGEKNSSSKIFAFKPNDINEAELKGDKFLQYQSSKNDLGNLTCDFHENSFYFLKNDSDKNKLQFDLNKFHLDEKKLTKMTQITGLNSFFIMDGTIIAYTSGHYYIVGNRIDFKSSDALKIEEKEGIKK